MWPLNKIVIACYLGCRTSPVIVHLVLKIWKALIMLKLTTPIKFVWPIKSRSHNSVWDLFNYYYLVDVMYKMIS